MSTCILIVDDNPVNMKLAVNLLEFEGCSVLQAMDAAHALEILESAIPDLILMDLAMPGMDGLTLTRHLKSLDRFREVPIVALTASAMKGDSTRAFEAGCDGYITKPVDTRKFGSTVLGFLLPDSKSDRT